MWSFITLLLLLPALVVKGCVNPEKTADGMNSKNCVSDEQCSLSFYCEITLSLCCPKSAVQTSLPACDLEEKGPNGEVKTCTTNNQCSIGYQCHLGTCCAEASIDPIPLNTCDIADQEKITNGQVKMCKTNDQCSELYMCWNGFCCFVGQPLTMGTCNMSEKLSDNMTVKLCNKTEECSQNYVCSSGTCCHVEDNVVTRKKSCPSLENMAFNLCFDIDESMRCHTDADCKGEQLCCQSGCGKICTEAEKPMTLCQKQLKMSAVQLLTKKDICTPVFIPRCASTGEFQKKQCLDMQGICWCVNSDGTKIPGSEVRGNPDCSTASRPGRCPRFNQWMTDLIDDGCVSDNDCPGTDDKCCYNGLGYQCVPPDGYLTTERNKRSLLPGCPNGGLMKCCDVDLCLHAICPKNPYAVCRINPCNDCTVEFYDRMNRKVDFCFEDSALFSSIYARQEGMSTCEKMRNDRLNDAVPVLGWIDTTNPPWLESPKFGVSVTPFWIDTTNPPWLESTPAPQSVRTASVSPYWLDTTFLLEKISDDDSGDTEDAYQSSATVLGDYVCPAVLPTTIGICQQQCNSDNECSTSKKCCFNGCANTCQEPVQVTSIEACKLPPISGECINKPYVNRTFYNQDTESCEPFLYKDGCHGNDNNFLTTEACERACMKDIPDHCLASPEPGACNGYFPMWFYNVTSGKCQQFIYGGCHGNRNKFTTELQCYVSCSPKPNVSPPGCEKSSCPQGSVCRSHKATYMVPYFIQKPESYIVFPPMTNVFTQLVIELTFKPEVSDGLILYNGNENTGSGDFISFGLKNGYPEFSFDLGSGPALITASTMLYLNEWHTVRLERNEKMGTMTINNQTQFTGESLGHLTGLDLSQNMYIGGVPVSINLPKPAVYPTKFTGAISQLTRNGEDLDLLSDAMTTQGIKMHDVCWNQSCMNNSRCLFSSNNEGYQCVCPRYLVGDSIIGQGGDPEKPSPCQLLSCSENTVCLAYNETLAECVSKTVFSGLNYYMPDCEENGLFSVEQCSGTTCWCVDQNSGAYIQDSMRIGFAPCSQSSDELLTDSRKPVCSNGNTPSPCIGSCEHKDCPGNPSATCSPDPCNNCSITFVNYQGKQVSCDKIDKCQIRKPEQTENGSHIGCGNPVMRYTYNPERSECGSFLFNRCDGPDIFFTSLFDCIEQCAGAMCQASQPMTCENTCASVTCPYFTGAQCRVNLCSCQSEFYDPITGEKVNCDKVYPVCQLQRAVSHYQLVSGKTYDYLPVCDEKGEYEPQQCDISGSTCWCVDGTGQMILNSKKQVQNRQQDIGCTKNTTKSAVISFSFLEDYDTYVKGKEAILQKLILDRLKKMSKDFGSLVKTITIKKGSVKVDVELEADTSEGGHQVASHANLLESELRNGFTVDMDGKNMTASTDTIETTLTFQPQKGSDTSTRLDGTFSQTTIIIIVIVVVCAVLFIVLIVILIYAKRRSDKSKGTDLPRVEDSQHQNSLYFKNDACYYNEEKNDRKYNEEKEISEDEKS